MARALAKLADTRWEIARTAVMTALVRTLGPLTSERFVAIWLNEEGAYLGDDAIVGIEDAVDIRHRALFARAIQVGASGVVIAHNHPSQLPVPSVPDMTFSARWREIGGFLGVPLIDHLIVGGHQVFSLSRAGLL